MNPEPVDSISLVWDTQSNVALFFGGVGNSPYNSNVHLFWFGGTWEFVASTTYVVTFSESGLPSGLNWTVTVHGVRMSLTTDGGTDILSFASEPNGSYSYTIADILGWPQASVPYSGSEVVSGRALTVVVTYTQATYAVKFFDQG